MKHLYICAFLLASVFTLTNLALTQIRDLATGSFGHSGQNMQESFARVFVGTAGDDFFEGSEFSDHIDCGKEGLDGGHDIIHTGGAGNFIRTNQLGSSEVYLSGGKSLVVLSGERIHFESLQGGDTVLLRNVSEQTVSEDVFVKLGSGDDNLSSKSGVGSFNLGAGNDDAYFLPDEETSEALRYSVSNGDDSVYLSPYVSTIRLEKSTGFSNNGGTTALFYCSHSSVIENLESFEEGRVQLFDYCDGGIWTLSGDDDKVPGPTTTVPPSDPGSAGQIPGWLHSIQYSVAEFALMQLYPVGDNTVLDFYATAIETGIEHKLLPGEYREAAKMIENGNITGAGSLGQLVGLPLGLFGSNLRQKVELTARVARLNQGLRDILPGRSPEELLELVDRLSNDELSPEEQELFERVQSLLDWLEKLKHGEQETITLPEESLTYLNLVLYFQNLIGPFCYGENIDSALCDLAFTNSLYALSEMIRRIEDSDLDDETKEELLRQLRAMVDLLKKVRLWSGIVPPLHSGVNSDSHSLNQDGSVVSGL
jgi:hypothetical protein